MRPKFLFFFFVALTMSFTAQAQTEQFQFEVTVSAGSLDFAIPTSGRLNNVMSNPYDWKVDWGDATGEEIKAGNAGATSSGVTHSYASAGTYTITIQPNGSDEAWLAAFGFSSATSGANSSVNRQKITKLVSPLTPSMTRTTAQLTGTPPVNEWENTFSNCTNLTMGENFTFSNEWNSITEVGLNFANRMFFGCSSNDFSMNEVFNLPSGITTVGNAFVRQMFAGCNGDAFTMGSAFNLPTGITATGTHFAYAMFYGCNGDAFTMNSIFNVPQNIVTIGDFFLSEMFAKCSGSTFNMSNVFTFPAGITTAGKNFANAMFSACKGDLFTMNSVFNLPQNITTVGTFFVSYMFDTCSGNAFTMNSVFNLPNGITTAFDNFVNYTFAACTGSSFMVNNVFKFPALTGGGLENASVFNRTFNGLGDITTQIREISTIVNNNCPVDNKYTFTGSDCFPDLPQSCEAWGGEGAPDDGEDDVPPGTKIYKYVITGTEGHFTAVGVKSNDSIYPVATDKAIDAVVDSINTDAANQACTLQFGNGNDTLNLGLTSIQFTGTPIVPWGVITLRGKITSSTDNSGRGTLWFANNVSVNSYADIFCSTEQAAIYNEDATITVDSGTIWATAPAIFNTTTGTINVKGGLISAEEQTIANVSGGVINVSGGEIVATKNRAINNTSTGKINVSGTALITSKTPKPADKTYGTIHLVQSSADTLLRITGGTVRNDSTGYAVLGGGIICIRDTANISALEGNAVYSTGSVFVSGSGTQIVISSTAGSAVETNYANIKGGTLSSTSGTALRLNNGEISGGHITSTNGRAMVVNAGTVTVSGSADIFARHDSGVIYVSPSSTLDVRGGTVQNLLSGITIYNAEKSEITGVNAPGGTVKISGGTISTSGTYAIFSPLNKIKNGAIVLSGNPAITGRLLYPQRSLSVEGTFSPSQDYDVELDTIAKTGDTVVLNGGNFLSHFNLYNPGHTVVKLNNHLVIGPLNMLSFHLNGGTGTTPPSIQVYQGLPVPTEQKPVMEGFSKEHYNHDGKWYTKDASENYTEFVFGPSGTIVTADTALYVKWSLDKFTVTFDWRYGGITRDTTVEYAGKITKPADPTRPGHEFQGWFREAEYTNPWDFDNYTVSANERLYAKWLQTSPVEKQKLYVYTIRHLTATLHEAVGLYDDSTEYEVIYAEDRIQVIIDSIKADAAKNDCSITFGTGSPLNFGTNPITFDANGPDKDWGLISLYGKMTSSVGASSNGSINLDGGTSIRCFAEIINSSTGVAILNKSHAMYPNRITIGDSAVISSKNTLHETGSGTIFLTNGGGANDTVLHILGGTIKNESTGNAVYSPAGGQINIDGGSISATDNHAVYSVGKVNMTSGTLTATGMGNTLRTGNANLNGGSISAASGMAIFHLGGESIIVSDSAKISSNTTSGSIYLDQNNSNLEIRGGSVNNGATGHAIHNQRSGAIKILGGKITTTGIYAVYHNTTNIAGAGSILMSGTPEIVGRLHYVPGKLSVDAGFAPDPDPVFTVELSAIACDDMVVVNGAPFEDNFSLYNPGYSMRVEGNDLVVNCAPAVPHNVHFSLNGGAGTPPSDLVISTFDTIPLSQKPVTTGFTKTGYILTEDKWFVDTLGTTEFIFGDGGSTIVCDTTLYLKWTPEISEPVYYKIISSAGEHGTISPLDTNLVLQGDNIPFTLTPNVGYMIDSVWINSIYRQGVMTSYTFYDVQGDSSIHVTFKLLPVSGDIELTIDDVELSPAFNPNITEYTAQIPCGLDQTVLHIEGYTGDTITVNGTILPNNPDVFDISAGAEGSKQTLTITLSNGSRSSTYTITLYTPFSNRLLHTSFGSTLEVVNNPEITGGYTFTNDGYTWFKNNEELLPDTTGVLYQPAGFSGNTYYALVTYVSTHETNMICPKTFPGAAKAPLRVYPNPAQGELNVEGVDTENAYRIEIYTLNGVLKGVYSVTGKETEINISHLPKGMYIIRQNNQSATIIKE